MPKTLRFAAFALMCTLGITTAATVMTATTATASAAAHTHPAAISQPASLMCTTCWT